MKILENDISSIEPFGMLDGKPVKLLVTKGGLNMAAHIDAKGNENVIGAASHRAILSYTLEQRYPNFQPMIMKSEGGLKLYADNHSHFLSDDLRKSGYDIFSVQNGKSVNFYLTKMGLNVGEVSSQIKGDTLYIDRTVSGPFECPHNQLAGAISEKALCLGINKVKVE